MDDVSILKEKIYTTMTANFPPEPVYPLAIDTDRTLYLVYNTTESILASDNEPWSDEIEIVPVGQNDPELWADNGFGTIGGELFYYDSVEKNSYGKVFKLKKCLRNLGGEQTQYNSIVGGSVLCPTDTGTIVRGLVVAEHHNQIALAIYNLEKFIGYSSDTTIATLDYRIRCLQEVEICTDDACATISSFAINQVDTDGTVGCQGITIEYNVSIEGAFTGYKLDFGDGTFTTTETEGSHTYSPGAIIDPIVIVDDPNCQLLQSPMERINISELPQTTPEQRFEIPIPELPEIPDIDIPDIGFPEPTVVVPPIVFPFLSLTPLSISVTIPGIENINIPSLIEFGPVNIPSIIYFEPANPLPSIIEFGLVDIPSLIEFGPVDIPDIINFGPVDIPDLIEFGPVNIPSIIEFGPVNIPSVIEVIGMTDLPSQISVDWGTPPSITGSIDVVVTVTCSSSTPTAFWDSGGLFIEEDNDKFGFETDDNLNVNVEDIGIPTEIQVVAPNFPRMIKLEHDLPEKIDINAPYIPDRIFIEGPAQPLPDRIEIVANFNLPDSIELTATNVPQTIELIGRAIPDIIRLDVPSDFPQSIKLDASEIPETIKVTGVPETITLVHDIPKEVFLKAPEDLEIPIAWKGAPIDVNVKVDLDVQKLTGEDKQDVQCVAIVPCPQK